MKKTIILTFALLLVIISYLIGQNFYKYYKSSSGQKNSQKPEYTKEFNLKTKNLLNDTQKKPKNLDYIRGYYLKTKNLISNTSKQITVDSNTKKQGENKLPTYIKKSSLRTSGNYIGIDFINTHLRYKNVGYNPHLITDYTLPKHKNGFGIKYLYAKNYKRFFIAPELFFEYNNTKKQFDGLNVNKEYLNERLYQNTGYRFMKINRIYGGKINFGYDVTPSFSSFLFAGLSRIYYSNLVSPYDLDPKNPAYENIGFESRYDVIKETGKDPHSIMHKSRNVPFFGFGSKIKLSNHFLLNAEYLIYKNFRGKSNGYEVKEFTSIIDRHDYIEFNNKLRVIKVGLLYNF